MKPGKFLIMGITFISILSFKIYGDYEEWSNYTKVYLNTTVSGAYIANPVYQFPVLVKLTSSNFVFDITKDDGGDLRFTKQDGTPLDYVIERFNKEGEVGEVWVKVDVILPNDSAQYFLMYWGNETAESEGDGPSVFENSNHFVGAWLLGEDPGDGLSCKMKDQSGSEYHGKTKDYPSNISVDAIVGKGLKFDGYSDYVWLCNSTNIPNINNLVNNVTFSAWAKSDDLDGHCYIAASKRYPGRDGLGFGTYDDHPMFTTFGIKDYILYSETLQENTWYYITAVMDENNDAKLYIDGSYKGTVEGNNQGDPGTTSFLLGSTTMVSYNVLDQLWGGTIDNVRISSTVRSEEWIKLCYENQKVGQTLVTFGEIVQGHVYPQTCGANENMKVDGQIKCNSLLIHDWLFSQAGAPELPPDYVFTKGYNLQSLKEIEEYVKKHGHLPGIPSEEELRKNGVDMIQLNFMLLKKIEEMILHMIRQEKEIEELKKAVK